jgi:hypothetical protein
MVSRAGVRHNVTEMPRVKRRPLLNGRVRMFIVVFAVTSVSGAACSVFDLGDVVATIDGGNAGDGASPDGIATDGNVSDSPSGPCVEGGDPCDCVPFTISPKSHTSPEALIVSGGTVFFMVSEASNGTDPVIYSAPVDGLGGGDPLQLTPSSISFGQTMALGGNYLFLRRIDPSHLGIDRVSIDGGTTDASYFPLVKQSGVHLVSNSSDVFFASDLGSVCALPFEGAVPMNDPSDSGCNTPPLGAEHVGGPPDEPIYASDQNVFAAASQKILSMPISGGTLSPIASSSPPSQVSSLIENGGLIFWSTATGDAGTIWSANDDGGGAKVIVASPFEGRMKVANVVADSTGIWWSNANEQKIWSAARDGSNVHVVACESASVPFLTTDATYVYWMTSNGIVRRAPK